MPNVIFLPSDITADAPASEREVFANMQEFVTSGDYRILHSVYVARGEAKLRTEIDFVVVSKRGILCLEIKGGKVERIDGRWYYGKSESGEGPFKQAMIGMNNLRERILHSYAGPEDILRSANFSCGVILPSVRLLSKDPEVLQEVLFDTRHDWKQLSGFFEQCYAYGQKEMERVFGVSPSPLTESDVERVVEILRGDFICSVTPKSVEARIERLTEEQITLFDCLEENPRTLVRGGAGTGKTFLALEYARRCALAGQKVLFLCYNKMLASDIENALRERCSSLSAKVKVVHFHRFIDLELAALGLKVTGDVPDVFKKMVAKFVEIMGKKDIRFDYDVLLVDESQDLITLDDLSCMERMVKGGLQDGNWHFFYDANQNLFNKKDLDDGLEYLSSFRPARLHLKRNLRTVGRVGCEIQRLLGISPGESFLVDNDGMAGDVFRQIEYKTEAEAISELMNLLAELEALGEKRQSIMLLSHRGLEKSLVKTSSGITAQLQIQDISGLKPAEWHMSQLHFSTIQAFKGLEAPIVILLDVKSFDDPAKKLLQYTAMTRARRRLFVFRDAISSS